MIAALVDRFGRLLTQRKMKAYGSFSISETALVVLSAQNDFLDPSGPWADHSTQMINISLLTSFLKQARAAGLFIVHAPIAVSVASETTAVGETLLFETLRSHKLLQPGSDGARISRPFLEDSDTLLPEQMRLNAFFHSELDSLLRKRGIRRLVLAGGVVNANLDSTARMAVELDYDVTVVSDIVTAITKEDLDLSLGSTLPRIVARVLKADQVLRGCVPVTD